MMAQLPEEWKSKRAKTKKRGAGTKRPGFGSRLQSQNAPLQLPNPIVGDFAVSLKNLNLTVPPPRLNFLPPRLPLPILKYQEGSVEDENQSEVKVTILKRPDAVTVPPPPSNIQFKSTKDEEQEQLVTILKRPGVLTAEASPSEESSSQNRVLVKSLKQREEEYAEARQRILGCLEEVPVQPAFAVAEILEVEEVPSTSVEPCSASVPELLGDGSSQCEVIDQKSI